MMTTRNFLLRLICALGALIAFAPAASANTCSTATSQGTAPADWQSYCWLDFAGYNDVTAKSAAGQNFSFSLSDGSTLTMNVKVSSPNATAFVATAAPSWTGAAVGNSAFIGIPGTPIIYTAAAGVSTVTFSNIVINQPLGGVASVYMFVAADAESTDNSEALSFQTNAGNWQQLSAVPPISGAQYPPTTGVGTQTFGESGGGLTGNVGGYIVGSQTATTVTTTMTAGGLQGAMFAVRFASMQLTKVIQSSRINAADQFTYSVISNANGATLTTGTTTGTGNGPFSSATVSLASGVGLTLTEAMAPGSVSTLANYNSQLTCTNAGGATVVNQVTTSYNYGPLAYGDAIACRFTNTPVPRLTLVKALGGTRVFTGDQFQMNVKQGATTVATTTTTGTGSTVTTGSTPQFLGAPATSYSFSEAPSGTTNLTYYTSGMACTNAYTPPSSPTVLPTTIGGTVTPQLGDNITCTITNTPKPNVANLTMTKTATLISDPINGTTNPKYIPGAIVDYTITVTNAGTGPVDAATVVINDPIPANLSTFTGASAVTFTNGSPVSGLSFAYPGNVTFTRSGAANPDGAGFESVVTNIRIAPTGTMGAATAAGQPSFSVKFRTRVN